MFRQRRDLDALDRRIVGKVDRDGREIDRHLVRIEMPEAFERRERERRRRFASSSRA
jgi:hypothetical protein